MVQGEEEYLSLYMHVLIFIFLQLFAEKHSSIAVLEEKILRAQCACTYEHIYRIAILDFHVP